MATSSLRKLSALTGKLCHARLRSHTLQFCRAYAITGNTTADRAISAATGGKAEHWLSWYENAVGLAEVREAQSKVVQVSSATRAVSPGVLPSGEGRWRLNLCQLPELQEMTPGAIQVLTTSLAEQNFMDIQGQRREKQVSLGEVQASLRGLSAELEKVHRGEERYLALLTQEHAVIKEETRLREATALLEEEERATFAALSSAVRDSHEKERARTERTKYWSVIGSVVGAAIGIIGTSINNYLRMRELRGLVTDSTEGGQETRGLVTQLSETMKSQHNQLQSFISDLRAFLGPAGEKGAKTAVTPVNGSVKADESVQKVETHTKEIMDLIIKQDSTIKKEMKEIKDFLSSAKITDEEGKIVYVAPMVGNLLENTEKNLEWKMKLNSLWTVTFIYGAFALTIPVLYNMFRGGGS